MNDTRDQENAMDPDSTPLPEELTAPSTDTELPAATVRRGWMKGASIVATGLLAGALGVAALQGHGSTTVTNAGNTGPAGAGRLGQGFPGGPGGGVAGESRVEGILSATGAASITVTLTDGTNQVVPVSSSTQILRNGAQATLSQLVKGESVLVHVVPNGTGTVAERIFAGTMGQVGPGFGPPPGQQQGAPTAATQGSGTVSTT